MEGSAKRRRIGENDGIATTEGGGTALSSGYDYEVFLSFRGPDTRSVFTDFLYVSLTDAGIRTFKDDEELRIGEEFSSELLRAINQSKISIPIFSKGYASSAWCLKELAHMVECQKTKEQKIMPIFYDVAPSEVRHQTGSYGEAFLSHENNKRYDEKTLHEWKAALKKVSFLNGWDLHNMPNRREGQFARELTQKIFIELKKAHLVASDYLVGVNNHVDAIMEKIGAQTRETRIIGIYGMGGIGKTTTAKIIYNQLSENFEGCSFLSNIRETFDRKGIEYLQDQLISSILKTKCTDINNIDEGIKIMKERLSNKRVLLLLDDMHETREMAALVGEHNWFGKGSKLIITTRNIEVLDLLKVDDRYELTGMDRGQSLQLFSKHAFRRDSPLDEYIDQSNKVIDIAKGLPLALEVIGSLLFRTEKKKWNGILEKLKNVPATEVRCNLKISYDALGFRHKRIFLDIACIFIGYKKDDMVHFWEESNFFPELAIDDLQNRSLIKIEENNEVWMHDQLRDLGRDIVREESSMKKEMQSRVWDPKEASDLLRKHKGKKRVEALRLKLDNQKQYCFSYESFESLPNLRFLEVDGPMENFRAEKRLLWHESPSNDFPTNENSDLLPQLRWLSWRHIPPTFNITNFSMEDVVILDLSYSDITEYWKGWNHIKVMKNLKVLNLSVCLGLDRTPIFSSHPNLERLILHYCQSLIEIDASICQLRCLVSLDISDCTKLQRLPDEFGRGLANLKFLSLSNCDSLERLPDSIGNLKSLIKLDISKAKIKELPDSIRGLANLEFLSLSHCYSLERLPNSIRNLKELKVVVLRDCRLSKIPGVLWSMGNLKIIIFSRFYGYKKRNFGVNIGKSIHRSQSLTTLTLEFVNIYELPRLPESLIKLELSELRMDAFPDLSNLTNLKEMDLHFGQPHCGGESDRFGEHPMPRRMRNLEPLDLHSHHVTTSPTNLALPPSLDSLRLRCFNLHHLPRPPSTLSSLRLENCAWFFSMEDLSNLKKLSSLHIRDPAIAEIQGLGCLENLRSLKLSGLGQVAEIQGLGCLENLRSLELSGLGQVAEIQGLGCLENLRSLKLSGLGQVAEIQGLGCLENLRSLKLSGLGQLEVLSDLTNLNKLTSLEVHFCNNLVEIQGEPQSLEELKIDFCESLRKLPNLSRLIGLHTFNIKRCHNLVEIQGEPQSLEELKIDSCNSLRKLPNLSRLIGLHTLDIQYCDNLVEIQGELSQSLVLLRINSCKSLQKLPSLSSWTRLQEVSIGHCNNLVEIPSELPQSLEKLKIVNCVSLQKLPYLSSSIGLREVCIQYCDNLVEIPGFLLQSLEKLEIVHCKSLQKLPYLSSLIGLREVCIQYCDNLVEIPGFLPQSLEKLEIVHCKSLQKLPYLSSLIELREVRILYCNNLVEIPGFLPQSLEILQIDSCKSLQKLLYLSSLTKLRTLCIGRCNDLVEIQGELPQSLESLAIFNFGFLQKLPYLSSLARLRQVWISNCDNLVEIPDQLPQSLKYLHICECQSLQELPNLSSLKRLRYVCIERCGKLNVQAISSLCLEKSIKFSGGDRLI